MPTLPFFQIDAFARRRFEGNPAAVVPLTEWLPDETLQNIAAENNLSETAFVLLEREGGAYPLRWFTPTIEVPFCGHATMAAAHVLMEYYEAGGSVAFAAQVGRLAARRSGGAVEMDFPAESSAPWEDDGALAGALGRKPQSIRRGRYAMAVYETEDQLRALEPDMEAIAKAARGEVPGCVIATAPGAEYDFVSRFFGPGAGVPEDPVTGSAHSSLIPFWAERLGKEEMRAWQGAGRGGEIGCRLAGERVILSGGAVVYARGEIYV